MIISALDVSKSFGRKSVLENVNFSADKGEIVGLIGSSGSGKSVLIKVLVGFFAPTTGRVVLGSDNSTIGLSMQDNSLYDKLTVKQNLYYFSRVFGVKNSVRKNVINGLISRLELTDYQNVLVSDISGGTKKRVDIACALVHDPDIVFFDEPLLGLDPKKVDEIIELLVGLKKEGKTIIVSSHILDKLSNICDRIILVKDKKAFVIDKRKIGEAYG